MSLLMKINVLAITTWKWLLRKAFAVNLHIYLPTLRIKPVIQILKECFNIAFNVDGHINCPVNDGTHDEYPCPCYPGFFKCGS